MKEFNDIESDVFDAPNALNASNVTITTRGHKYKTASQTWQVMRLLEVEFKKNRLKNVGCSKLPVKTRPNN